MVAKKHIHTYKYEEKQQNKRNIASRYATLLTQVKRNMVWLYRRYFRSWRILYQRRTVTHVQQYGLHVVFYHIIGRQSHHVDVLMRCTQLEKDTRSDSEVEETDPEDENVVDRATSNNNLAANSEQNSRQLNDSSHSKKKRWPPLWFCSNDHRVKIGLRVGV